MTVTDGGPAVLGLRGRSFVLVAGIPGAGKSSLVRRLPPGPPGAALTVLDSDPVREWLRDRLPDGTDYRLYRPFVHLWHRVRIVCAAFGAADTVVVHLPATASFTRGWLAVVAAAARRRRHLVWIHVAPDDALRGQRDRGRVLAPGGFARHARRGSAYGARLSEGYRPAGWRVTLLDRPRAGRGLVLATDAR